MMHHPNMHHQAMSGHPPQHLQAHQGMPGHHQMPPHQMHRENRHVTLTRVPLGPSTNMGHPQGMSMGVHQPPPHSIRPMHHPQQHHVPMKPMRRPYVGGGYSGVSYAPPEPRVDTNMHRAQAAGPSSQKMPTRFFPQKSQTGPVNKGPPVQIKHNPGSVNKKISFNTNGPPVPIKNNPVVELSSPVSLLFKSQALKEKTPQLGVEDSSTGGAQTTNTSTSVSVRAPPAPAHTATSGAGDGADAEAGPDRPPADDQRPANSKEKTPMCLVNELARYNKIKHQYRLTSEMGPAHQKVFTVTLRLGDTEEYTAEGSSIKRAQHAAASAALAATGFPAPPPRAISHTLSNPNHRHSGAVMPTVELNALAMKLCQPAVYAAVPPLPAPVRPPRPRAPPFARMPPFPPNPFHRMPALIYRVRVSVGGRAWLGEGVTPQAARHDAAARALHELRPEDIAAAAPAADADTGGTGEASAEIIHSDGVKSPVSLVHELALKRNLSVTFSVKSERGPPHMRVFVTACTVGDMETEGEGNGKKVSKRRAAERMLDEMRRRWPPALLRARPTHPPRPKPPIKKKPRNLIKQDGVASPAENGSGADNPISRLAVARHAARARSPQYRVVEERGQARRREFLVQCDAPPHTATGLGPNKKAAKRRAAHNVLLAMENAGERPPTTTTNGTETNGDTVNGDVKRKEGEPPTGGGANSDVRQPVPGVIMMDYHQRTGQPVTPNGVSETSATGSSSGSSHGAKDQLMYLSQLLGFTVQFSDFPKRNHGEYLSLVSLSTEPPVMCHGGGPSTAHSHEQCARAALRALAHMGLDAASDPSQSNTPALAGPISNGTTE